MPRVEIVPGFMSDATDDVWSPVYEDLASRSLEPYPIRVRWRYSTMEDNVEDVVGRYDGGGLYGHSFGALACLYAALQTRPDFVVASSPSPYLAEYIDELDQDYRDEIGKRRTHDFRERSVKELSMIQCPVHVFYEDQALMRRVASDIGDVVPTSSTHGLDTKRHRLLDHYDCISKVLEEAMPLDAMRQSYA